MSGTADTQLARISILEKRLAKCRTVEEYKQVGNEAEVIAHAAKKLGAHRDVANQALRCMIESKVGIGQALGEPPGSGRNKVHRDALLPKGDVRDCRAACWKVSPRIRERYADWIDHHSTDHLAFRHILMLSRLDETKQDEAVKQLETGAAESLAKAIANLSEVKPFELLNELAAWRKLLDKRYTDFPDRWKKDFIAETEDFLESVRKDAG